MPITTILFAGIVACIFLALFGYVVAPLFRHPEDPLDALRREVDAERRRDAEEERLTAELEKRRQARDEKILNEIRRTHKG